MTIEEKIDHLVDSLQGMEQKLQSWQGYPAKPPTKHGRNRPGLFKASPKRSSSPRRTDMLVRLLERFKINTNAVFREKFAKT